jgi:hypothetical protein
MALLINGDKSIWNVANESDIKLTDRIGFKKEFNDTIDEEICNIVPEKRIGSASTMGEVYDWHNSAVKIMPILNKSSFRNNMKEIDLAKEVSDLVISGLSSYFPIVYRWELCDDTLFYRHSESVFAKQSRAFQKSEELQSHLLFSELAFSDLKNYIHKLNSLELNQVISQVFRGIADLQVHCGIVHNDLHLGNILLLYKPSEYGVQILIHDFGRSVKVKSLSSIQKKKDIIIFLNSLREEGIALEKLDGVLEILDDSISNYPILEVIKYWDASQ